MKVLEVSIFHRLQMKNLKNCEKTVATHSIRMNTKLLILGINILSEGFIKDFRRKTSEFGSIQIE